MTHTVAVAPPREIRIVPRVGLGLGIAAAIFVVYSIASNSKWALMFCHVAGGGMWTAVDLYVGIVIGPILGRLSPPARAEFAARFMPKMVVLMPTVVMMTLAAGFQLAIIYGNLYAGNINRSWLIISMIVVGVMAVIALGLLEPANIAVLYELRKPEPNPTVIATLMKRFIYTSAITGAMQILTLVIMTRISGYL